MRIEVTYLTYYFCDACHYCFKASALPDRCPDCGKEYYSERPAVRPATKKEEADLLRAQTTDNE